LFRGKRISDGRWVEGSLVVTTKYIKHKPKQHTKTWIVTSAFGNGGWFNVINRYCVREESVGQYTGIDARDGKKIFEGDIVMYARESRLTSECTMIGYNEVIWNNDKSMFDLKGEGFIYKAYDIVGNIHDKEKPCSRTD